jgi:hypothetical protein
MDKLKIYKVWSSGGTRPSLDLLWWFRQFKLASSSQPSKASSGQACHPGRPISELTLWLELVISELHIAVLYSRSYTGLIQQVAKHEARLPACEHKAQALLPVLPPHHRTPGTAVVQTWVFRRRENPWKPMWNSRHQPRMQPRIDACLHCPMRAMMQHQPSRASLEIYIES